MLDRKFVVNNPDKIKENNRIRGMEDVVDVDKIVELEATRKKLIQEITELRTKVNKISKQGRVPSGTEREESRGLSREINRLNEIFDKVANEVYELLLWVPNLVDPRVPVGDESKNKVIRKTGEIPQFDFPVKSHAELGADLGLIDFERGVKLSGSRFNILRNEAVLMRAALAKIMIDHLMKQGFELISPPLLVHKKTLVGTGYLPFATRDNFNIEGQDLTLIGTSEQPLITQHMDEMLDADKLPLRYVGESQCFRTEVGSAGKDTHGMMRTHQFFKVEQIVFCAPEDSEEHHLAALENEEWILKELGIPFQTVLTSTEDLAPFGKIKYDLEAWIPSEGKYREMTSNTNMDDYQTRRSNIRAKRKDGRKFFPHTISATGFADRLIIAIMENYQREDGSIEIPEKLRPYMNGMKAIVKKL